VRTKHGAEEGAHKDSQLPKLLLRGNGIDALLLFKALPSELDMTAAPCRFLGQPTLQGRSGRHLSGRGPDRGDRRTARGVTTWLIAMLASLQSLPPRATDSSSSDPPLSHLTGTLLWLRKTRPDLNFADTTMSHHLRRNDDTDMVEGRQVLGYGIPEAHQSHGLDAGGVVGPPAPLLGGLQLCTRRTRRRAAAARASPSRSAFGRRVFLHPADRGRQQLRGRAQ
jgi:hypothetical protein